VRGQDVLLSFVLHLVLLSVIVLVSSTKGRAREFNPDDIARVQLLESIPGGTPKQVAVKEPAKPASELPAAASDEAPDEPVKLATIEKPAKTEKKETKKTQPTKEKKSKEKPAKEQPVENKGESTGKATETVIGEGEVSTSIGIGSGIGGSGTSNFPYDIVRVTQLIDRNWENPVLSQYTLRCVIYFQIDRNGSIKGATIEQPSGNDQFDMYALNAVIRTAVLPPLPISYKYDVLGFHLEFEYAP
jgi:TonB family protein